MNPGKRIDGQLYQVIWRILGTQLSCQLTEKRSLRLETLLFTYSAFRYYRELEIQLKQEEL